MARIKAGSGFVSTNTVQPVGLCTYDQSTGQWTPVEGDGGALAVQIFGEQCSANTTTTALGSGATYTGEGKKNNFNDVMVSCQTDNTGTLYFDFSVDGTNWSTFPVNGFEIASGVHEFHTAVKGPRWFRVRLVNDTGAQSYLRLYTYYGQFRQGNSPLNQSVSLDTDASHVRPTSFEDEVRIGRRSGVVGWTKFGYRTGLVAATGDQTVWATTGNFTPLTAASTFNIAYNSTTDGAGQNGALTLSIWYIDSDGLPAVAVHTLGNDGDDTTSFSGLGINRIAVASSGSANTNTNAITVTATTGGTTQAVVPALGSVTQQAIFFVGSNHDAVAKFLWYHVDKPLGSSAYVQITGKVFNRQVATTYEVFRGGVDTTTEETVSIVEPVGFNLSPTDVLWFEADTNTNDANITLRFSLLEYQRV